MSSLVRAGAAVQHATGTGVMSQEPPPAEEPSCCRKIGSQSCMAWHCDLFEQSCRLGIGMLLAVGQVSPHHQTRITSNDFILHF